MSMGQKDTGRAKYNQIIARAWSDPDFKQRFVENPKAVAAEYGLGVPDGLELRVVENTPGVVHIVLPSKPVEELSEEQLDAVSGGVGLSDTIVHKWSVGGLW